MTQSASILLVDDEPALRNLMKVYLERTGYSVSVCADAASAIALVSEDPGRFQLVIADIGLPDMSGDEMCLRLHDMNPDMLMLVCSGHPFETDTLPPDKRRKFASLLKPFLPNMLLASVKELLER